MDDDSDDIHPDSSFGSCSSPQSNQNSSPILDERLLPAYYASELEDNTSSGLGGDRTLHYLESVDPSGSRAFVSVTRVTKDSTPLGKSFIPLPVRAKRSEEKKKVESGDAEYQAWARQVKDWKAWRKQNIKQPVEDEELPPTPKSARLSFISEAGEDAGDIHSPSRPSVGTSSDLGRRRGSSSSRPSFEYGSDYQKLLNTLSLFQEEDSIEKERLASVLVVEQSTTDPPSSVLAPSVEISGRPIRTVAEPESMFSTELVSEGTSEVLGRRPPPDISTATGSTTKIMEDSSHSSLFGSETSQPVGSSPKSSAEQIATDVQRLTFIASTVVTILAGAVLVIATSVQGIIEWFQSPKNTIAQSTLTSLRRIIDRIYFLTVPELMLSVSDSPPNHLYPLDEPPLACNGFISGCEAYGKKKVQSGMFAFAPQKAQQRVWMRIWKRPVRVALRLPVVGCEFDLASNAPSSDEDTSATTSSVSSLFEFSDQLLGEIFSVVWKRAFWTPPPVSAGEQTPGATIVHRSLVFDQHDATFDLILKRSGANRWTKFHPATDTDLIVDAEVRSPEVQFEASYRFQVDRNPQTGSRVKLLIIDQVLISRERVLRVLWGSGTMMIRRALGQTRLGNASARAAAAQLNYTIRDYPSRSTSLFLGMLYLTLAFVPRFWDMISAMLSVTSTFVTLLGDLANSMMDGLDSPQVKPHKDEKPLPHTSSRSRAKLAPKEPTKESPRNRADVRDDNFSTPATGPKPSSLNYSIPELRQPSEKQASHAIIASSDFVVDVSRMGDGGDRGGSNSKIVAKVDLSGYVTIITSPSKGSSDRERAASKSAENKSRLPMPSMSAEVEQLQQVVQTQVTYEIPVTLGKQKDQGEAKQEEDVPIADFVPSRHAGGAVVVPSLIDPPSPSRSVRFGPVEYEDTPNASNRRRTKSAGQMSLEPTPTDSPPRSNVLNDRNWNPGNAPDASVPSTPRSFPASIPPYSEVLAPSTPARKRSKSAPPGKKQIIHTHHHHHHVHLHPQEPSGYLRIRHGRSGGNLERLVLTQAYPEPARSGEHSAAPTSSEMTEEDVGDSSAADDADDAMQREFHGAVGRWEEVQKGQPQSAGGTSGNGASKGGGLQIFKAFGKKPSFTKIEK
ncbi:hypothetical protein BJ742DRAFT_788514 [Cladochytrium replicatum]|nr:hypothetical protein BJ742DRAFT_788514 [Cladochytrium replicatum]